MTKATPLLSMQHALKVDPEGAAIYETELTVEEVRAFLDNPGELEGHPATEQFDRAQGIVEGDVVPESFLVIRIRP
jgi:hypothetical protein